MSTRRGSALLIVLGFLSFMVVSAIAFAVFMRAERAPSSALRRGVVARHLAKAALAQAISAVDDAVREDVFPGWAGFSMKPGRDRYCDDNSNDVDFWGGDGARHGRVFMPLRPDAQTNEQKKRYAPVTETVSVLNFEGLGYLPPPIVNDVRFFSRCTWSASWQNLPYDAGRFAYVAVNVSDYLDVNKLTPEDGSFARGSGDEKRISLASLFTDKDGNISGNFTDFANALTSRPTENGAQNIPYVSLLDFNLALGAKLRTDGTQSDSIYSPFWSKIENGTRKLNENSFYAGAMADTDPGVQNARRMPFVTDSWIPHFEGSTGANVDAAGAEKPRLCDYAPFRDDVLEKKFNQVDIRSDLLNASDQKQKDFWDRLYNGQNELSLEVELPVKMALFDYLDPDSVPLSLVQPSVERIPMLTAFEPYPSTDGKCNLGVVKGAETLVDGDKKTGNYTVETPYVAQTTANTFPQNVTVDCLFAYPFRHAEHLSENFKARALVRYFLTVSPDDAATVPLRPNGEALRRLRPKVKPGQGGDDALKDGDGRPAAVVTYVSPEMQLKPPASPREVKEIFANDNTVTLMAKGKLPQPTSLFTLKIRQTYVNHSVDESKTQYIWESAPEAPLFDLSKNGDAPAGDDAYWRSLKIRPCMAVWIMVQNEQGEVVDYVPAVLNDDFKIGQRNESNARTLQGAVSLVAYGPADDNGADDSPAAFLNVMGETRLPVEKFANECRNNQTVEPEEVKQTFLPQAYYAVDPRYNWAPEDWLAQTDKKAKPEEWADWIVKLNPNGIAVTGNGADVFLGFSDQGVLQSLGEFAMLPLWPPNGLANNFDGKLRSGDAWQSLAHGGLMWLSMPSDCEQDDPAKKLSYLFSSDGDGVRVNPYTDSDQLLRAVVACTPWDWSTACTNTAAVEKFGGASYDLKKDFEKKGSAGWKEALKYAFCKTSSRDGDVDDADLEDQDVEKIINVLKAAVRNKELFEEWRKERDSKPAVGDFWEYAYDRLPWTLAENGNDPRRFLGVDLQNNVELYDVERKYLYSFWRDCFANKQQLFLIFVRAESSALGGTGEGSPAQQGARAVALVWRDPNLVNNAEQQESNAILHPGEVNWKRQPHRTRILFYHQFD